MVCLRILLIESYSSFYHVFSLISPLLSVHICILWNYESIPLQDNKKDVTINLIVRYIVIMYNIVTTIKRMCCFEEAESYWRTKYILSIHEFHKKNNVLWKNCDNVTTDGRVALTWIKFGFWAKNAEIALNLFFASFRGQKFMQQRKWSYKCTNCYKMSLI